MSPRKASLKPRQLPSGSWQVSVPPEWSATGKRQRRSFETEEEARRFADRLKVSPQWLANADERRLTLMVQLDSDLQDEYGRGLLEIGQAWELEQRQSWAGKTLGELMEVYRRDYEPRWRSPKNKFYQLRNHLEALVDEPLHKLTSAFWSEWMAKEAEARNWSAGSFNGYVGVLLTMFQHGVSLELVESNPIKKLAKRREARLHRARIWEVDEARQILKVCWETDRELIPWLACGLFLGLRPESELMKLRWEHFDWEHLRVEVIATKTAKRRWPDIQPNLAAWLEPFKQASGSILPVSQKTGKHLGTVQPRRKRLCAVSGVVWSHDVTRHTYGSYLAALPGMAKDSVLKSMGNTLKVFESNYENARKPEEAEAFWGIMPPR